MAEITKGPLKDATGHLGGATIYQRGKKTFIRETHIVQPHRLSRTQLVLRERIAHNNILWRRLKATRHTHFEGGVDAYRRFIPNRSLGPISSCDVKAFSCSPESKECLPLIHGSHKT